ncbi:MAG: pyridinium-3,5-bisthiocarboxylic acid mononucleotide nickel chelatase [Frankiales bacterium]|nr:pyridinium-3,5-bisthiocarboxylic acid mononucleotide nickel chelatase [Frankiales bacterium]
MSRVAWVDASMGVSGDMLLGALAHLGAFSDGAELRLFSSVPIEARGIVGTEDVNGLTAMCWRLEVSDDDPQLRRLADVLALTRDAAVPDAVKARAAAVFQRLAVAEGAVHGISPADVHFHEVGAADSIVDVLLSCLGLHTLGLDALVVSPISLGGGTIHVEHGELPVPGPAVLELLHGSQLLARGGPFDVELATPTGVALLAEWATGSGPMPAMQVERTGLGAGTRRFDDRANVLRLVLGESAQPSVGDALLLETNVDDLEPRLWPGVIAALLDAGASDAWLTPILMKKGRPAHTLSVLTAGEHADAVRAVVFTETSAIGLREREVRKHALERRTETVTVRGHEIRVKLALHEGRVVNAQPEWDDVAGAAAAHREVSAKQVLAEAIAAAQAFAR